MVQLLGSVTKKLTVSYSAYDTVENRMIFPSGIMLQIYRLLANNETLDYSHLLTFLGERKGFIPSQPLEALAETEWWLNCLDPGTKDSPIRLTLNAVQQVYPTLFYGLSAELTRKSPNLTPYDGLINSDCTTPDPTVAQDIVVSCTQLETLAKCPFAYFLRYILRVKPVEELVYDPNIWLDAKTTGDLYHQIFEQFYIKLSIIGESPLLTQHEDFLYELADELITQRK